MRKILLTLLTAFLFTTIAFGATTFKDINSSAWYYSSVSAVAEKGLIKGYEDGTFRPNNTLTYGEFIKMMTIAVSGQDVGNSTDGSYWAMSYYNRGLELKLYDKTDIGFNAISMKDVLSSRIDRRHMALLIGNYLGDVKIENYAELLKTVSDVKLGSDYEYEIMEAYTVGILNGYSDGTFKPDNTLTRKEAATVLLRVIDPSERVPVKYEDPAEEEKQEKENNEYIESILEKTSRDGKTDNYQYYGVNSAQELKEKCPIIYYSYLRPKTDSLLSKIVTNIGELYSIYDDRATKTYTYADMEDIGIIKIEMLKNKYNSEILKVTPTYIKTNKIQAVLIKGNKIVCHLTASKSSKDTEITYWAGTEEYYNGEYKDTKLMDFDYIGFYDYEVPTVFLVKTPF